MQKNKDLAFGLEMRNKMLKGVNTLASAVKLTLGPKGRNVVIQREYGRPVITKDGVSVAEQIQLKDHYENMGATLVKEIASRANDAAGDGTTTATVLASAFINEGFKLVNAGLNPMDIKRGIDKVVAQVVVNLEELSTPANNPKAIEQVATISANNDTEVGALIAKAVASVDDPSVITSEEGTGFHDELITVKGMQFERGYLSPYFVNNPKNQSCVFENPNILIVDQKINHLKEIYPVLEIANKSKAPLFIIAQDYDDNALAPLILNAVQGRIKVCAIKAPGFGQRRSAILQDLAILTNGVVVDSATFPTMQTNPQGLLGSAGKVVITKDSTTIIDGRGSKEAIANRIAELHKEKDESVSEYDTEKLLQRIARLSGGVAVIKVGGATEVEMKEKSDRVVDALSATRAAIAEGVVPGGGLALIRASQNIDLKAANDDEAAGIRLALKVMEAPLRQIVTNCGLEASVVVNKVREAQGNIGFNAATEEYGDLFSMGILDPTKVTRVALQNAASIAGLMLTTECMIAFAEEDEKEATNNNMGAYPPGYM